MANGLFRVPIWITEKAAAAVTNAIGAVKKARMGSGKKSRSRENRYTMKTFQHVANISSTPVTA
jgi:hypothetical protein